MAPARLVRGNDRRDVGSLSTYLVFLCPEGQVDCEHDWRTSVILGRRLIEKCPKCQGGRASDLPDDLLSAAAEALSEIS